MWNIFWGALIIGIGLYFGQSVFQGDFSILSLIFDGLGLFWIGKGVLTVLDNRKKQPESEQPPDSAA